MESKVFPKNESISLEEDDALSSDSDSLENVEFGAEEGESDMEEGNGGEMKNISEGEYVLVRVAGKKTQHFYVVKILQLTGDILEVRYLKKTPSCRKIHSFIVLHKPMKFPSVTLSKYCRSQFMLDPPLGKKIVLFLQ
ncbi:hypothetical protein JTB14_032975 [Gonioctena quinquepunctata]|nr:hypothetical protein JTB14_032975 [Gonioctena quinquepunctata]